MLIIILIFMLLVLFYVSYISCDKDIMAPSVIFIAPFILAVICAAVYSNQWYLDLSIKTFLSILFGSITYVYISLLTHLLFKKKIKVIDDSYKFSNSIIIVSNIKVVITIIFQVLSLFFVIKSMRSSLSLIGVTGNLSTIMYSFRYYSMFSDKGISLSGIATNMRIISIGLTYIWIYILINNKLLKYKNRFNELLLFISIVLGILNSIILGARGEALQLLTAIIVIYFCLRRRNNSFKADLKFSQIFKLCLLMIVVLMSFKSFGTFLGRDSVITVKASPIDEVAKYLGAEIKNLDIVLNQSMNKPRIFGEQTFSVLWNWLNSSFDMNISVPNILIFRKVNGISLGNVYTLYYPLIYDFGYLGMIIAIAFVAFVIQLFYENMYLETKMRIINYKIIVYSYIMFLLFFSFFGEKIFSSLLNFTFYKYLIVWYLMTKFVKNNFFIINIRRKRG